MNHKPDSNHCPLCGSPITVEMDGIWTYRVCTRNRHIQGYGSSAGPLASAAMMYSFRT